MALHESTTADTWSLEIGRDGPTYECVMQVDNIAGQHQDTPTDCSINGYRWQESMLFTVPDTWRPGGYLITLRAERGDNFVEEHHLILIRCAPAQKRPRYLLVCATGTWQAYNCWGGSNHYEGIAGKDANAFSPVLSSQRPWSRGFCKLPDGAPRAVPDVPPKHGEMTRYPYMEWAYAYGYSKKYASAGWASYERHFAHWAETMGYDLNFASQDELDCDPDRLSGYVCVIFIGHDEYWSAGMRDTVDAHVDGGGKVARFAGDFLWQTRLSDQGKTQTCYKYIAETDPFLNGPTPELNTSAWDIAPANRPGALTFG